MSSLLIVLMVALLIATVGSLFSGLVSMGIGGELDDRKSERLMFTRVALQGLAVALVLLLLVLVR